MNFTFCRFFTLIIFTVSGSFSFAAKVDTVEIFSNKMNKNFKCVVVRPSSYSKQKKYKFPVAYLLHGFSGDFTNWIKKVPEIKDYADQYNMLIVCPEGGYASWYLDAPLNASIRYESYIAEDVPRFIDQHYRTDTSRNARFITGLSMGGHGAIFIAWRHSKSYGAVASMSGGVDLHESANKYAIENLLGAYSDTSTNWKNYSVVNLVSSKTPYPLKIMVDCGVNDQFINGNRLLHKNLLDNKIAHEYIERPGGHGWDYWKYSIHFQLLFFKKIYDEKHKQY